MATDEPPFLQAVRLHQAADWSRAVDMYHRALREDPDNAEGWFALGTVRQAVGE